MIEYCAYQLIARNLEGFAGSVEPDNTIDVGLVLALRELEDSLGNRLGLTQTLDNIAANTLHLRLHVKVAYNSTLRISLRDGVGWVGVSTPTTTPALGWDVHWGSLGVPSKQGFLCVTRDDKPLK
jgi:hypothetical protein